MKKLIIIPNPMFYTCGEDENNKKVVSPINFFSNVSKNRRLIT